MKILKIFRPFFWAINFIFLTNCMLAQQVELLDAAENEIQYSIDESTNTNELHNSPAFVSNSSSCLSQPVSVSFENENLESCLKKISRQTGINFVYENDLIDDENVNLTVENESLRNVFDILFEGLNINAYEYSDNKVVLARSKNVEGKTGVIKGIVKDNNGEPLLSANVVLTHGGYGCATDEKGNYIIKNIKPGTYTLNVSYVGYENFSRNVRVVAGETVTVDIVVISKSFQIGGIEVVGTTELLPKDVNTKTTISSSEIEHYQASSVKDVLDLVPGVQKSDNPGLGKNSQLAIRGDDGDKLSTFGTLVVVDGSPVSNNANMQFEKMTSSGTSTGWGVDLRTIPADNIESIEIVTGLPSVRYGDVTEGVVNIKTKTGYQPHRLKLKNNPDTYEANLGGGFRLKDGLSGLSYNFNLARSERDIRKEGDEYTRITGQTVYSTDIWNKTLSLNHKINSQVILDEESPKGDIYKTNNYNRGFSLGYSSWGDLKMEDKAASLSYNVFVNYRRENSMKSKLIQSDLRVLPNGDTVSSYIGKVETRGNEWGVGGRVEWNKTAMNGDFVHKILLGTDLRYDANTGDGIMFDTLYSYYGAESGKRPYSFDQIPGQLLASLYAEDKITGHLLFDFSLMLGVRYEMYRPFDFNLKGLWGDGDLVKSHNGSYFNPRANLMFYLSKTNQFRMSAGITSKSPSMATLFPPESVIKWRDPNLNKTIYLRYDSRVPDLKGFREAQYEIAYDHKLFNSIGTSFSAYYKERNNEYEEQDYPVFVLSQSGSASKVYYVDEYKLSQNLGWTITKGLEFSIKTNKIKPLNMNFELVGSYSFSNNSRRGLQYTNQIDSSKGQYATYHISGMPIDTVIGYMYTPEGKWNDRFQLNYYVKYTLAPLGLWVTLRAEQLVYERYQSYGGKVEDISLLTDAGRELYLFGRAEKRKPVKWLFNINISKSLFKGAEVSFYVNNFLDDPGLRTYSNSPTSIQQEKRNPDLFYGIEFSCTVDNLL